MKPEIKDIEANLNNPAGLERLYRADKQTFKRAFNALSPQIKDNVLETYWSERLKFTSDEISWGSRKEFVFVIVASLIAGAIAKLPVYLGIPEDFFYQRNAGFIVFPFLTAYFAWKNKISTGKIIFTTVITLAGLIFINALPNVKQSDTLILSCIHLLLFLWSVLGFTFIVDESGSREKHISFLKYNGDLVVITTLIVIAAGILSGITIGLFSLIGFNIEQLYFENIVIFGLPAAPIFGTYLIQTNPHLVGKVSPVIAKIFSPLVLFMLVVYLVAIAYSGKDPYNDREFLFIFNALLVGVMAIIFFSVSYTSAGTNNRLEVWMLFLLSALTIIVNSIALSAILFRIWEGGFTANRTAVLGGNLLILINLLIVTVQFFKVLTKKADVTGVGKAIASYLPVYVVWTMIVTFLFPLIFGFK